MVELVVTIVLIGILSAVAIPRMNFINDFDQIGYRDQIIAALNFARKSAVAQRRNVRVTLSGNALSFDIAGDYPEGAAPLGFTRQLLVPGSNSNQISPRGSTTLSGPATLIFSPSGATAAATYTVSVDTTNYTITVDATTGYAH